MRNHESGEQICLFKWAALLESKYPELRLLHAIPNGGFRMKTTAKRLKAEGTKAGVPDIHLPVPKGGYASLYVELKAGDSTNRKGSPAQRRWIELTTEYGNYSVIAIGWREAADIIESYVKGHIIKGGRPIE
jgi:hypothetical protein